MGIEADSRWLKVDLTGGDRAPLPLLVRLDETRSDPRVSYRVNVGEERVERRSGGEGVITRRKIRSLV